MEVVISDLFKNSIDEYRNYISNKINNIIEDSTYSELSNYLQLLPKKWEGEKSRFYWGMSFLNEYYKAISFLNQTDGLEIDELKKNLYILYLREYVGSTILSYHEFITFSRLLNTTFLEYNPNIIRERDLHPFQDSTPDINNIINEISRSVLHSPHPHAYEISKFNLDVLIDCLTEKKNELLNSGLSNIDLDDYALNKVLSKDRIKELKDKINH